MNPSDPLLGLLAKLFGDNQRSALAYPALLAARRLALATRGLSVDPDKLDHADAMSQNTGGHNRFP